MSYDFWLEVDTGGSEPLTAEPHFSDAHPDLRDTGDGETALMTRTGYTRIGNYTSNVSPMWTRCLTAVMEDFPAAHHFAGSDDRRMLETHGSEIHYVDGSKGERTIHTDQLRLRDLQGARCGDISDLLKLAVEWGIQNLDELRESNPENGWGNAEGAVTYLWDIQRMCEAHPKAELRLSS